MSYVLILEDFGRQIANAQLIASIQRSLGAEVEVPDWDELRAEFDRWLISPPPDSDGGDPDRAVLMRALKLA